MNTEPVGALGWIFQRIGQPRVIGEMTAGILSAPPKEVVKSGMKEVPKDGIRPVNLCGT